VGNLGEASPAIKSSLRQCLLNSARDMEVRTAAVAAHRRLPCLEAREFFMDLYRNQTQDTEIRIAAYLQAMRCPNYNMITLLRSQLDLEEVNQGKNVLKS